MFYIFRSTTEKLAQHLNQITGDGDQVFATHHTGGRDWIIVCRKAPFVRSLCDSSNGGL